MLACVKAACAAFQQDHVRLGFDQSADLGGSRRAAIPAPTSRDLVNALAGKGAGLLDGAYPVAIRGSQAAFASEHLHDSGVLANRRHAAHVLGQLVIGAVIVNIRRATAAACCIVAAGVIVALLALVAGIGLVRRLVAIGGIVCGAAVVLGLLVVFRRLALVCLFFSVSALALLIGCIRALCCRHVVRAVGVVDAIGREAVIAGVLIVDGKLRRLIVYARAAARQGAGEARVLRCSLHLFVDSVLVLVDNAVFRVLYMLCKDICVLAARYDGKPQGKRRAHDCSHAAFIYMMFLGQMQTHIKQTQTFLILTRIL